MAAADCDRRNGAVSARADGGLVCRAGAAGGTARAVEAERGAARKRWLHRILERLDARSAERIHANDAAKLIRAIEVCLAARRPMSEVLMGRDPLTGFRLLRIGLNPPRQAAL